MTHLLASLYNEHIRIQRTCTDSALERCGFDALGIHAGRAHTQFLDDQPYPFKANPHFRLWTPLKDAADCWVIYRPQAPLRLVFLQPVDYWYKPPPIPTDYWTDHFTIEVVREPADAKQYFGNLGRCAFIGEWQPQFDDWGFTDRNPSRLLQQLHFYRAVKTTYELECMRRASRSAALAHRAAETAFLAGGSEYDIHQAYVHASGHTESELPYPSIVALNANAAVLHYQNLQRRAPAAAERKSFLIDAGAEFAGYAADITRTYSAASDEFSSLISVMDGVQQALCNQVRPGVDYADIHLDAHVRIAQVLKDADLIRVPATQAVSNGLSNVFFPHGIGHLLGLQVHDVAGFTVDVQGTQKARPAGHPYLRLTRTLEAGFVVTIEPGLYFIDALLDAARISHAAQINWQRVEQFRPFGGIRVEDDVACTSAEPENLTRRAFAAC